MASVTVSSDCEDRKRLLREITENNSKLKTLAESVSTFIECSSFISSNAEIQSANREFMCFAKHAEKVQETFKQLNEKLYDLAKDEDEFPVAGQTEENTRETETFKEKRELSMRVVMKTKTYIQNPIYMHSALQVANSLYISETAGKFLRRQWSVVFTLLKNMFPEEVDQFPSPCESFTCPEKDVFGKIQMPLIRLLDYLCEKLSAERLANHKVHDNFFSVFKTINIKYEKLFTKTIWQDEEWLARWGSTSTTSSA